jgi:uncharacterized membrane protein YesL
MTSRFPAPLRVIGRSIVDWWDGWLDMVMVIAVWFFAQLTIVLGPPATFGVYYVVQNMINGEATGVRGLIEGARKHFWKAIQWGVVNILVVFVLSFSMYFYGNVEAVWGFYLFILVVMMSVLWVTTQFYAIPYYFEQDIKSLRTAWRNGVLTTLATPLYTLVLMIVVIILVVVSFGFVIPIFLGVPAIVPVLGFRALDDRLIAFGIRKPELTPREVEMEESSKIESSNLDRLLPDEDTEARTTDQ